MFSYQYQKLVFPATLFLFLELESASGWGWLVDTERACALLVGRCLGGMLIGLPMSNEEKQTSHWLHTHLLSNGLCGRGSYGTVQQLGERENTVKLNIP